LLVIVSLVVVLTVVFVIAPHSLTDPVFEISPPKKDVTVVAVGDSLTKGKGDPKRDGYVGYVQDHLRENSSIGEVTVYNYGIVGDTTDDLIEKLQDQNVLDHISDADLIMFTVGGNDMMNVVKNHFLNLTIDLFQEKRQHYQENLKQILNKLRDHNDTAQIVYVGVFNPFSVYFPDIEETGQIIDNWDEAGENAAKQFDHTEFISISDLFENKTKRLISDDHFHPNAQGYQLIGGRILEHIDIADQSSE